MNARRSHPCLAFAFLLAAVAAVGDEAGQASAHTPMGAVISNPTLAAVGGGARAPQGSESANVLVFFRPDNDYNRLTLKALGGCEKRFSGKSVRITGLVAPRFAEADVKSAVAEAGVAMPVVVDAGEALATELGVAQLPAVAITDAGHKLVAYQPFTKVNFCELVEARVRWVIKEISDAELAGVVNPAVTPIAGASSVAHRHVKMAEAFLNGGNAPKAVESARAAVQSAPELASAHSMLGAALQASGDCKEASREFEKAIALDASDARAKSGRQDCAGK